MATQPKRIKVQKYIPTHAESENRLKDLVCQVCYYYPRYSYAEALQLQIPVIKRLLKTAQREKAREYAILVQIAAAPKTKNMSGVSKLSKAFNEVANG